MKTQLEQSSTFKSVKEFNKLYKQLREEIMIRHGYEPNAKVKLVNAVQLHQTFDGENFVKCTSIKSDMIDRIKMYETDSSERIAFKLIALV